MKRTILMNQNLYTFSVLEALSPNRLTPLPYFIEKVFKNYTIYSDVVPSNYMSDVTLTLNLWAKHTSTPHHTLSEKAMKNLVKSYYIGNLHE